MQRYEKTQPIETKTVSNICSLGKNSLHLQSIKATGDSLSWLERLHGMQEVIGSSPIFSTATGWGDLS